MERAEHMFDRSAKMRGANGPASTEPMTSQGHAVSRFARAVKTGNPNIVVAAAAELPRMSLADALLVLLVFAGAGAPQTEAAAVRWAARYLAEVRPTPRPREAHLVLSAACALAGRSAAAGTGSASLARKPTTAGRGLPGARRVGAARALTG